MNDKIISTFEDESEVLMYQGHRVKFNFSRSVWARLIQASDVTKANYKEIREYISSFENVKILLDGNDDLLMTVDYKIYTEEQRNAFTDPNGKYCNRLYLLK